MTTNYVYIGQELNVFVHARRWKAYWSERVKPYLGDEVLEVGAGIGSNTEILCSARQRRWVCLEPDVRFLEVLNARMRDFPFWNMIETRVGTVQSMPRAKCFDSVIYIDVLEHIEDDQDELEFAAQLLKDEGTLVVLAPAHQWLFSPFDRAIGHFRRYTKKTLAAAGPPSLRLEQIFYLDSVGLLASSSNLLFLRQRLPTTKQIEFWDRWLLPFSIRLDPWLRYGLGKTVVGIWRKEL